MARNSHCLSVLRGEIVSVTAVGCAEEFPVAVNGRLWHLYYMSTLTVELPDELASRLEAASRSRSVPPAEVVRELVATLPSTGISGRSAHDVLGATFGQCESGGAELAEMELRNGFSVFPERAGGQATIDGVRQLCAEEGI